MPSKAPRSLSSSTAIVVGIVALAVAAGALVVVAAQIFLLIFLGILGAIGLEGLASVVQRHTRIPHGPSLALVIVALVGTLVGLGWLVGPPLDDQLADLAKDVPVAAQSVIKSVRASNFARSLEAGMPAIDEMLPSSQLVGGVAGAVMGVMGGLVGALFVVITSVFFAARPDAYIDGIVSLVPLRGRARARHLIVTIAGSLRSWLVARLVSMLAVGVLTGLGLWIAGIPVAAALGVLAGALSFIPNLGPILGALPGVLLGFSQSPAMALWAALVYAVVQILEGNLITPFAEQRAVHIPPALLLSVQLLAGAVAGVLGLMVATPLLAVVVVTVQELYVGPMERRGRVGRETSQDDDG